MIKNFLFIALLFVPGLTFAQGDIAKSSWAVVPVKVDGKANDWSLPLGWYDSDTKLFFAFANDKKNLYLCFQSPDEKNQVKIMYAGMEVVLSTKGKHKVSVNFPLEKKSRSAQPENYTASDQFTDRKSRRDSFLVRDTMMEVKGFATKNGLVPIDDSSGINAAMNWDESNKLTYEISIPLKEMFGDNYSAADISKEISLEITIHALQGYKHPAGSHSGGSSMSGGRMGGGRMHHQRDTNEEDTKSEQPGDNTMSQFQKSTLKQKFILAPGSDLK